MLCSVHVLFENIIMPINKRYQVVRNWKSKATCENMFTTTSSCVISLDVSVKWDYPMQQNKIEGKTQILFIVFMLERFCAWNDWHANLTSFFFIYSSDKCLHTRSVNYKNFVWDIFLSQTSFETSEINAKPFQANRSSKHCIRTPKHCCCRVNLMRFLM